MEIINNRYRVEDIYSKDKNGIVYVVTDIFNNNQKLLLKVFDNMKNNEFINYLIDEYIYLRGTKHKYLQEIYDFDIIQLVNNKKTSKNNYFYTKEFIPLDSLENDDLTLSIEEIKDILTHILELMDYLELKGISYNYLGHENLFIDKSDEVRVKVIDIITIKELEFNNIYNRFNDIHIKNNNNYFKDNITSFSKIADYLIGKYIKENDIKHSTSYSIYEKIVKLIINTSNMDVECKYTNCREVLLELKGDFSDEYINNLNDQRDYINYHTKIIGREKELEKIDEFNKGLNDNSFKTRIFNVLGESGSGKTKFLDEVYNRLRLNNNTIFKVRLDRNNKVSLNPFINIIKSMLKYCNEELVYKYGSELVKLIPEIGYSKDIKPSPSLSIERENLRLYDRVSRFLVDTSDNNPVYIVLDHFYNCDIESLELLTYYINNFSDSKVVFIISNNENKIANNKEASKFINHCTRLNIIESITMTRFNLKETALMIQNMLGMNHKPLEFSTRILKETKGNPRHIEEVIKSLYSSQKIKINKRGYWSTFDEFDGIYIPSNIDDGINKQIEALNDKSINIVKVISLFNSAVSKNIISDILSYKECEVDTLLEKLISYKLVDKMVEDLGFTYDLNNIKTKRYIYYNIDKDEKIHLHNKAAKILENLYLNKDRLYIDELINHFIKSNQNNKAVYYSIKYANKMKKLSIYTQAISYFKKAYLLLKDEKSKKKIEVLYNLGKLFNLQGKYKEALNYFNKSLKLSKKLNSKTYIVLCKDFIANIYFKKNETIQAENFANESKALAQEIDFKDGILQSQITLNRIKLSQGENEKVLKESIKYLYLSEEEHKNKYTAELLNQIGVVQMFMGKFESAEKYFNKSINYFMNCSENSGVTVAMNNLGIIYSDLYHDFDKAIKYFKKGIEISEKHSDFQAQITFLNNIGENYIDKHEYYKAKEYLEKILTIAKEVGINQVFSLVNINLGLINLKIGNYDECFKQYYKLKDQFENKSIQWQELSSYYEFLMKFYINFGLYDKAKETYSKLRNDKSKFELRHYLSGESMSLMIDYYLDKKIDVDKLNNLRKKYENSKLIIERKYYLLQFASLYLKSNKLLALDIINEYENIKDRQTTNYLNLFLNYIKLELDKLSEEECANFYKNVNMSNIPEIQILTNKAIGDKEFKLNNYYNAINYYAVSIDFTQRLLSKIPNEEIKNKLKKSELLKNMFYNLKNIESIFSTYDEIAVSLDTDNLNYYYDFSVLDKYFQDSKLFDSVIEKFNYKELNNINNIEDLLLKLSSDQIKNLELILKFAMKETFAERGYILYVQEGKNILLANSQNDDWYKNTNDVIKACDKMKDGILVKSLINTELNQYDTFINEDIKSLICIPIYKNTNNILDENDRRSFSIVNKDEVIGYIYLDTGKLFNKFNKKSFDLIKSLSSIALINIDNYYLKIISSIDKLTGAYTRKYMDTVFDDILIKSKSMKSDFSIIMIDIDKFKFVNDTYGHQKGDEILTNLCKVIMKSVRKTDIVSRYGGEEFLVILPNTDRIDAKRIAEKIRVEVMNSKLMDDYPITISSGISTYPYHAKVKDDLIEKADQALYSAKNNGRNKAILWNENISNNTKRSDKLAGIITGNTVEDQRKVLAMIEIIDLVNRNITKEDKMYLILGRIVEIIEGEYASLVFINKDLPHTKYTRKRFYDDWILDYDFNDKIIDKVVKNKTGECIIDWETVKDKDVLTGNPNWHSIITVPLIYEEKIDSLLYISVPIKEKEFDYKCYNFIKTIGDIIANNIKR